MITTRKASAEDLGAIREIYNQGIEDRVATLEADSKTEAEMQSWFAQHGRRYTVLVALAETGVVGWASLNRYTLRCAHAGVADLSVYVRRDWRGRNVGSLLLSRLEDIARDHDFHKIVLFTFSFNQQGQRLYRKMGYREVGTLRNQGKLDGTFVDVMLMEKLLYATSASPAL